MPPRQGVIVAVPDQFHYEIVKECLMHNQHVLCVKPLVLKYDQAVEVEGDGAPAGGGEAVGGALGKSPLALISAPFRALAGKIKGGFQRVLGANRSKRNQDKTAVYRFAAYVDNICGVLLFIGYIVAMAVILAVYS